MAAAWQVYLHFSPPMPAQPAIVNVPSVDPEALKRLKESQEKALNAETCVLENVARQIGGAAPLPCPAPETTR